MNKPQGLRMKFAWTMFLLSLTAVSASFEMNETKKDIPAEMQPESMHVGDIDRGASDPSEDKKETFFTVMAVFIIVTSVLLIACVLNKACRSPKAKDGKPKDSLDVEKNQVQDDKLPILVVSSHGSQANA